MFTRLPPMAHQEQRGFLYMYFLLRSGTFPVLPAVGTVELVVKDQPLRKR